MNPQEMIGHYRIVSKLGEGGMGAVYRAKDTRLNRDVAIKVLPDSFAADPDRLSRFAREAQVLASLNHPNIAALYGIEERALVMEFVDGASPAGPLSVEQALPVIHQLIDALEYAHEKGIIHRDLKPANMKVTPEGRVKVLDFGLAKAISGDEPPTENSSDSPTLTMRATMAGVIMGTAAYMAPEQARGNLVDKRADIWAFGVVLYELLTGKALFEAASVPDTLAAVLTREPDFDSVPPRFRRLMRSCLNRDPRLRLRDISGARILLEEPLPSISPAPQFRAIHWVPAAVLFLAASALAVIHFRQSPPLAPVIRTYIPAPDKAAFNFMGGLPSSGPVAISPDGRRVVFSARGTDGKAQLWLRPLDALTAQPLAGTDEAIHPFWSPDSRFIGFFAGSKLKKMDLSGGPPVTICDAGSGRGGTWNEAGTILFAPTGTAAGLHRVSAAGGVPVSIDLDTGGRWPWFLPDGHHFLFSSGNSVRLGSLESKQTTVLIETLSDAAFAGGHVIYLRDNTLMAQPFSLERLALSGEAVPLAENVKSVGSQRRGIFSVSQRGILIFQSGISGGSHALTWVDRSGKRLGTIGAPSDLMAVALSPDARHVVTSLLDPASHTFDLWLYEAGRERPARFTFETSRTFLPALWSPDGTALAYGLLRNGKFGLYRKAADLSGKEELLFADDLRVFPVCWTPDGKHILFTWGNAVSRYGGGLFALPLTGERKPVRVGPEGSLPESPRLSPDGRSLAYVSLESTRPEVYIMSYPEAAGKVQVSVAGGMQPRWRSDGKEIFYIAPDGKLMAAEVKAKGSTLEVGRIQTLFGGLPSTVSGAVPYDVAAGGDRFLVDVQIEPPAPEPLTVVQNWSAGLK